MRKIIFLKSNVLKLLLVMIALTIVDDTKAQLTNFGNLYINTSGNVSVNGSFVNTGSSSDVKNSGNLLLTGDFTNNGNDLNAAGTGTVIFNGTADQNVNGTQSSTFYNVSKPNSNNVIIASNETVNNTLTLNAGTFNLNNHNLTLNGAFTGTGTLTGSVTSGLIIGGNAGTLKFTQTPTGNYLDTLTLNTSGNATLGNALNITAGTNFGTVTVNTGSALNANGNLTLRSNAGGTSRVAESYGAITGNTTVERYIPANRAWRLLTSPLTGTGSLYNTWQNGGVYDVGKGTYITGPNPTTANGLDTSPQNNYSMSAWNTATQKLVNVANTKDTTLSYNKSTSADNKGYFIFVRGDRNTVNTIVPNTNTTTLSSMGKLQIGTQTFTAGGTARNYTLIGNPYASAVDFNKVTRTNLVKRLYFFDPTLNEVGGYVMLDDLNNDGAFVKSVTISKQDENIQSSEAFFVETMATAPASLVFNENSKYAVNNELVFRPQQGASIGMIRASLFLGDSTNKMIDGTFAEFSNNFSADINYEDALKFGNVNESFSMERKGFTLTAERRPELNPNDTLFYKLTRTTARNYRIEFVTEDIANKGVEGVVEDTYLNTKTPLNLDGTTNVDFSIISGNTASAASNRFRIVFKRIANPLPLTFISVKATRQDKDIKVEWKTENEMNSKQYEVERSADGNAYNKVATIAASGINTYNWLDKNAPAAVTYYRIKSTGINGAVVYSKTVMVNSINTANGIVVYPNPAVNNKIGLEMNNMSSGKYNCRLINNLGQVIFITTLNHSLANTIETLSPAIKITKGIYKLKIVGVDKKGRVLNVLVE